MTRKQFKVPKGYKLVKVAKATGTQTAEDNLNNLIAVKGYKFANIKPATYTRKNGTVSKTLTADVTFDDGKTSKMMIGSFGMWHTA